MGFKTSGFGLSLPLKPSVKKHTDLRASKACGLAKHIRTHMHTRKPTHTHAHTPAIAVDMYFELSIHIGLILVCVL